MDQTHEQLIRAVYRHFMETAQWPKTRPLQVELRRLGNIGKLAVEIGRDKISCDRVSESGNCQLTLRGFAECEGAEPEIQRFLWTVRALVKRYIAEGNSTDVKLSELTAELQLSTLELRRLAELIRISPSLWRSLTSNASDLTLTPEQDLLYFEEVQNIGDFYAALQRAREDENVANQFRYPAGYTVPAPSGHPSKALSSSRYRLSDYVHPSRIDELRGVENSPFDLRRLIAMCEELNLCAENECLFASAMLTRAIVDHVPPIFGTTSFAQVTSSYAGSRSFKASMQHLENSARKIADSYLHLHIRQKEVLPTPTQVDFSRDLDVLLGEIVRILS
jgi:hypothetical protein